MQGPGRTPLIGLLVCAAALLAAAEQPRAEQDAAALWAGLREGGRVVLISHAQPDDSPASTPQACDQARDLPAEAQTQARGIGEAFTRNDVEIARILSDESCAGLVTAALVFGAAEPWPALAPLAPDRAGREGQLAELGQQIVSWQGPGTLVLVTYPVNIAALTGIEPQAGEVLVLRPRPDGSFSVDWRFSIDAPEQSPS
jgi:hypothetical protein